MVLKDVVVNTILRGVILKDDSGNYAVFTEQGASAPHMTEADVEDVISRFPGCSGQSSGAVSAYTHVKLKDTPELLYVSEEDCSKNWIRLQKVNRP